MIVDHRKNTEHIPERFRTAFALLAKLDLENLPCGRYPLDGEQIFLLVMEPETKPAEEQQFEAHSRYIDIQLLASGAERIDYLPLDCGGRITEDRLSADDVAFYDGIANSSSLMMQPGMYAIFFPGELHKPCCAAMAPEKIRKFVVKVQANCTKQKSARLKQK